MTSVAVDNPFAGEAVEEVQLLRAPLVRVVAQVRFPKILSLATEIGVSEIQAELRQRYPILRQEHTVGILITPSGVSQGGQETETVWHLQSKTGDWTVSLGSSFVALDTTAYTSRADFCDRLDAVLDVIVRVVDPVVVERIGLRYTDRLADPAELASLPELVRPEILGGYAIALPDGVNLEHTLCESLYAFDAGNLMARWGVLPPGAVFDVGVPAVARRSWILDLDVFKEGRTDFDVSDLSTMTRRFADQAYRFFRWAVTEKLLRQAGGDL